MHGALEKEQNRTEAAVGHGEAIAAPCRSYLHGPPAPERGRTGIRIAGARRSCRDRRACGSVDGGGGGLLGRKSNAGEICSRLALASLAAGLWPPSRFRSVATCAAIKRGVGGWVVDATGFPFVHLGRAPQAGRSAAPGPTASDSAASDVLLVLAFSSSSSSKNSFLRVRCACVLCGSSSSRSRGGGGGGPAQAMARCSVAIE